MDRIDKNSSSFRLIMKKKLIKNTVIMAVFFCFYTLNAFAQNEIDITSDSFNMKIKEAQMHFSKNVTIKYKSFEAKCDSVIVETDTKTGKVLKLIMSGKVRLLKDNSEINGSKVIFEPETEKLTVEGSVRTRIRFGN